MANYVKEPKVPHLLDSWTQNDLAGFVNVFPQKPRCYGISCRCLAWNQASSHDSSHVL